jgi:Fe-S cluster assembly protein SufD
VSQEEMVSQIVEEEKSYQAAFRASRSGPSDARVSWLDRLRERAMDRFEQIGFPSVKEEEWKYTNVTAIARTGFSPLVSEDTPSAVTKEQLAAFIYPEAEKSQLVFVNGLLRPDLSLLIGLPEGVVAVDLADAFHSDRYRYVVQEYLARVVDCEENGFTALNTAFISHGAFILIPKGLTVESPLHLLFVSDAAQSNRAVFPRVLIVAEENSNATVIESYASLRDDVYFTNAVVEIVLKEGARVEHYRVQDESAVAFHVTTTKADLGRNTAFDTTNITLGAGLSRHNLSVNMDHEGAECWVDGLYIVGNGQHTDTHSVIDHKQPHCTSHQLYKGILDGKSRAVFNGKVFVRQGAQKTDAMQTNKNLLLSNEAHVDTKPQLEIFADDVKCAHGAAIGQLDEEQLFYLSARGIHSDLARKLLTYGFAEEVIAKIKVESIKGQLDEAVLHRLNARLEA